MAALFHPNAHLDESGVVALVRFLSAEGRVVQEGSEALAVFNAAGLTQAAYHRGAGRCDA